MSTQNYGPIEQAYDVDKATIRDRLLAGETIAYADADTLDDMRWDELRREMKIIEVPGAGYRRG